MTARSAFVSVFLLTLLAQPTSAQSPFTAGMSYVHSSITYHDDQTVGDGQPQRLTGNGPQYELRVGIRWLSIGAAFQHISAATYRERDHTTNEALIIPRVSVPVTRWGSVFGEIAAGSSNWQISGPGALYKAYGRRMEWGGGLSLSPFRQLSASFEITGGRLRYDDDVIDGFPIDGTAKVARSLRTIGGVAWRF